MLRRGMPWKDLFLELIPIAPEGGHCDLCAKVDMGMPGLAWPERHVPSQSHHCQFAVPWVRRESTVFGWFAYASFLHGHSILDCHAILGLNAKTLEEDDSPYLSSMVKCGVRGGDLLKHNHHLLALILILFLLDQSTSALEAILSESSVILFDTW